MYCHHRELQLNISFRLMIPHRSCRSHRLKQIMFIHSINLIFIQTATRPWIRSEDIYGWFLAASQLKTILFVLCLVTIAYTIVYTVM